MISEWYSSEKKFVLFKQLLQILIVGNVMSLAYVMLNTVPDKMETVLEEIMELEGVVEAYMLYGVYDIIAAVKAGNIEELKATILKIRKKKYVSSTLTLLVVS